MIAKDKLLSDYMLKLCDRAQAISDTADGKKDNMLCIATDGRKCALDMRLVDDGVTEVSPKMQALIRNVKIVYDSSSDNSQIVFCDISTPKSGFNIYSEVKSLLIECGIPEKEIKFIHSCKNEKERMKLFQDVNKGIVRILIGSTFKLGIGVNVQTKLKAIHHLDVPWRPSDMVQREGRIMRQGNTQEEIQIFRYITQGSFDAYNWQTLETKQKFISQFLTGTSTQKSAIDLEDEVLTYSKVKALAIEEPMLRLIVDKEISLNTAKLLLSQAITTEEQRRAEVKEVIATLSKKEKIYNAVKNSIVPDLYYARLDKADTDNLWSTIIDATVTHNKAGRYYRIERFLALNTRITDEGKPQLLIYAVYQNKNEYFASIEIGDSISGNKMRLKNFIANIPTMIEKLKDEIDYLAERKQKLSENYNRKHELQKQVDKLTLEYNQLLLDANV